MHVVPFEQRMNIQNIPAFFKLYYLVSLGCFQEYRQLLC